MFRKSLLLAAFGLLTASFLVLTDAPAASATAPQHTLAERRLDLRSKEKERLSLPHSFKRNFIGSRFTNRTMSVVADYLWDETAYNTEADLAGAGFAIDLVGGVPTIGAAVTIHSGYWTNPYTYDWQYYLTGPAWMFDTDGDGTPNYWMVFENISGSLVASVLRWSDNALLCDAYWEFNGSQSTYFVSAPTSCMGDPTRVRMWAAMAYDNLFWNSFDRVPDSGWTGWMSNPYSPTAPTAPSTPFVSANHVSADVSWAAPPDPYGAPVTDYVIQYSRVAPVSWATLNDGVSTNTSVTIPGLNQNNLYMVRVAAVNSLGMGPFSPNSSAVKPLPPIVYPSAPSKPASTSLADGINFDWFAPLVAGTGPIIDYKIQVSKNGAAWADVTDGVSTVPSFKLVDVSFNDATQIRVAAVSTFGPGAWSAPSAVTFTLPAPTTPSDIRAIGTDSGVEISWLPSITDVDHPVSGYKLYYSTLSGTPVTPVGGVIAPLANHGLAQPKIVGGVSASTTDIPWQVEFESGPYLCGGTLIDQQWVLTAAHCMVGQTPATMLVHSGIDLQSSMNSVNGLQVDQAIVHPSYNATTHENDIGLLHLKSAARHAVPIALNADTSTPALNAPALISGWGTVSSGAPTSEDHLRSATAQILAGPSDTCGLYGGLYNPTLMLCAGAPSGGIDTCQGDSGGPLAIQTNGVWTLAGVTSFGIGCADASYPGIYTRVSYFVPWIRGYVAATWKSVDVACSPRCTTSLSGLTPGDQISVMLVARNAIGSSEPSTLAGPFTVGSVSAANPGLPTGLTALNSSDSLIHLEWTAPFDTGGAPIVDYAVSDGTSTYYVGSARTSMDLVGLTNGRAYTFTVAAINRTGVGSPSAATTPIKPGVYGFLSVTPSRVVDTHPGSSTIDHVLQRIGVIKANKVTALKIGGRAAIPSNSAGVFLSATVDGSTTAGTLTVYTCGTTRPTVPNLRYLAHASATASLLIHTNASGQLCVWATSAVHLAIDVEGYFPGGSRFASSPNATLFTGRKNAKASWSVAVARRAGVPAASPAVMLDISISGNLAAGSVTVWPCDRPRPAASAISYAAGLPSTASILTALSGSGTICVYTTQAATVTVTLEGFTTSGAPVSAPPAARLVDTRTAGGTTDGLYSRIGTQPVRTGFGFAIRSRGNATALVTAGLFVITVYNPAAAGVLRIGACGTANGTVELTFAAKQTISATAFAGIGTASKVCVSSSQRVDVTIDSMAYFSAA